MTTLRHLFLSCAALLAALAPASMATSAMAADTTPESAHARVIVKFKADSATLREQTQSLSADGQHAARAQSLGKRIGRTLRSGLGVGNRVQVVMADNITSQQLATRLAQESDVEYAVVDHKRHPATAPSDPLYPNGLGGLGPTVGQWYLRAPSGTVQSSINVEPAWTISPHNTGVVVAVLDTGVRYDHADLMPVASGGNLLPGYDMISDTTVANDGNGRDADASDPGDWVTDAESRQAGCNTGTVGAENSSWHGTQTAGLIGALTDNGIGMASVGRDVQILPVRVLGKCGGYDSDIMAGMLWAAGIAVSGVPTNPHPAQVVNMSLGGDEPCNQAYLNVINQLAALNVVVVASAGNSAGHAPSAPANCAGVIAVAGLRHAGTKVGFSDLGPDIALSAPAGNCINTASNQPCLYPILTTTNAGTTTPVTASSTYTDSYNASLGTSFSAPLVSGTVALMLSVQPNLTPSQVLSILTGSARAFPTTGGDNGDGSAVLRCVAPTSADQAQCYCTTSTCGAGMLDAGAAVQAASAGIQSRISFAKAATYANQTMSLSGASSWVATGRSIAAYEWTVVNGGGIVGTATGLTSDTLLVPTTATGRFTVSLKVTDDLNNTSTTTQTIEVVSAPATTTTSSSGGGGGGGGGGGALDAGSLLALLAALLGAWALMPSRHAQA
jgi:serine protease